VDDATDSPPSADSTGTPGAPAWDPGGGSAPGRPRWVKVVGAIVVIVVVLVVARLLMGGGGGHGPARHTSSPAGYASAEDGDGEP
jgi:hypothetical protein